MLLVVSGNDPEGLAREMARKIDRPRSPFVMERVLIASPLQGAAVGRVLARELGIVSALQFLPPGRFLWDVLVESFPETPRQNPLSKDRIALLLLEALSGDEPSPEAILPEGVPVPTDPDTRWDLAQSLAEILDRIVIYRPDWIRRWETSPAGSDCWSRMWAIIRRGMVEHRVSLLDRFSLLCHTQPERLSGLSFAKTPVHVFGHSLLPPSFLDFLQSLSRLTDVVIYQWQPSQQYYSLPGRGSGLLDSFQGAASHRLTRSLGKQAGRMRDLLLARADATEEAFVIPSGGSLLSTLQREIIFDRPDGDPGGETSSDGSVLIHVARTPMGEVLALRQALLSRFENDPGLGPADCLILVSDLDLYAPFIMAAFDPKGESGPSIPYRITGGQKSPVIRYLSGFMALARGKCSALEVMSFLDQPLARERFGFESDELERLERWMTRLPVWWGTGKENREHFGDPELYLNTFEWGIDRLLLSFAVSDDSPPIGGLAPEAAGDLLEAAPVLQKFQEFLRVCQALSRRLPASRNMAGWGETLSFIVSNLFDKEVLQETQPAVYEQLVSLVRWFSPPGEEAGGRFGRLEIPFNGFSRLLQERLSVFGGEFRGEAGYCVTFSGMVAARGLPARFIGLLGMGSGGLTLVDRHPPFDPLATNPRPGDHSRREDDQEMVFEAVLLARDTLYISYSGSGRETPEEVVPASPVIELGELLIRRGIPPETFLKSHQLTEGWTERPLPQEVESIPRPSLFVGWELVTGQKFPPSLRMEEVRDFLRDPSGFFFRSWTGNSLRNTVSRLATSDPFVPDLLSERALGKAMFRQMSLSGGEVPPLTFAASVGLLPHGAMGVSVYDQMSVQLLRTWTQRDRLVRGKTPLDPALLKSGIRGLPATMGLGFDLEGTVSGEVFTEGDDGDERKTLHHVTVLPYRPSARDRIAFWFDHLVLKRLFGEKTIVSTLISWSFESPERFVARTDVHRNLLDLFSFYSVGLQQPLPLFPRSAAKYIEVLFEAQQKGKAEIPGVEAFERGSGLDPKLREKALEAARKSWNGDRNNPDLSPADEILYGNGSPWEEISQDGDFSDAEKLAFLVMAPMAWAMTKESV